MSYTPREGSLPWKVIEFLTTNPEEELSPNEISAKFDVPAKQIHTQLALAVQHGTLKRAESEDELVYCLGTGSPVIKPNRATNPSLHGTGGVWNGNAPTARASRRQLPAIDLAAVQMEAGIPIPAGRHVVQHDWPALFQRMQPGQSCVIPIAFRYVLGKACTDFKKAELGEMSLRVINEANLRLWRVK